MACTKHAQRFLDWEDHSKPIYCTVCEIERLRAQLIAAEEVVGWAQAIVTALVTGDVMTGSRLHHKLRDVVIEYRVAAQRAAGGEG